MGLAMEKRLQHRLIGAGIVIVLAIIFIPMFFSGSKKTKTVSLNMKIPPAPTYHFKGTVPAPQSSVPPGVKVLKVVPMPSSTTTSQPSVSSVPYASVHLSKPLAPKSAPSQVVSAHAAPKKMKANVSIQPSAPKKAATKVVSHPEKRVIHHRLKRPASTNTKKTTHQAIRKPVVQSSSKSHRHAESGFMIQLASFKRKTAAESFRKQVASHGYTTHVVKFDDSHNHTLYYRVQVGPVKNSKIGKRILHNLNWRYHVHGFLVPAP